MIAMPIRLIGRYGIPPEECEKLIRWYDCGAHFINLNPDINAWASYAEVRINVPDVDQKRAYERSQTGYIYIHGWYVMYEKTMKSKLEIDAKIGGYHGLGADRAWIGYCVGDTGVFDQVTRPSLPFVAMAWTMATLGYANGDYNKPLSGYIIFSDPPQYSFSPTDPPRVFYYSITSIPNSVCHVLYGFEDDWSADYDQWASLSRDSVIRTVEATPPPVIETLKEFNIAGIDGLVGKWNARVRGLLRSKGKGIIFHLGESIKIKDIVYRGTIEFSLNDYDRYWGSGSEPVKPYEVLDIIIETDIRHPNKLSNKWLLRIAYDKELDAIIIIWGDTLWDGDKYPYIIDIFDIP